MSDSNEKIEFQNEPNQADSLAQVKASIAALADVLRQISIKKEKQAAIEKEKKTPEKPQSNAVADKPASSKKAAEKAEAKVEAEKKAKSVPGIVKKIDWPAPLQAAYSGAALSAHERDFYVVRRRKNEISDFSVMHTYLSFKKAYDPGKMAGTRYWIIKRERKSVISRI